MNRLSALVQKLRRPLAPFSDDQRGATAIEFALLLPLMVTLYFGTVEVSQGIAVDRKVTLTARTVADLVSQVSIVNNSSMTDILTAASAVMYPYSTNTLKVTVTAVKIDANSKATVDWSDSYNGTAKVKDSTVTVPSALNVPNSYLIWSEVQYVYTPSVGYVISGSLTLKDQLYMAPRISTSIARTTN